MKWIFKHVWDEANRRVAEENYRLFEENRILQARVRVLETLVRALRDVNADLDGRLLEAEKQAVS